MKVTIIKSNPTGEMIGIEELIGEVCEVTEEWEFAMSVYSNRWHRIVVVGIDELERCPYE